jgi:hypothetical protein
MELYRWTLKRATMNEASENVGGLWKWTPKTAVMGPLMASENGLRRMGF